MARILVIDDDPAVRSVLGRMLQRVGHDPVVAGDGRAGIDVHRKQASQLGIVDLFMPVQGGLATIQTLRTESPALPIVAMSGADKAGDLNLAMRAQVVGANTFVKKPFEATSLLSIIDTLLK